MTARHIFLAISCAVLVHGTSYAAPSEAAPQEAAGASAVTERQRDAEPAASTDGQAHHRNGPAERRDQRRGPATNQPRGRGSPTTANGPKRLPNDRERPAPGNPINIRQPASNRSDAARTERLMQSDRINRALPVQPPAVIRPGGSALDNVRHRGPNPAIIGGTMNSNTGNTGAINGTRMNRRP